MNQEEDDRTYNVVMNHEEQYSIWPIEKEIPAGWKAVGKSGSKKECLDHIEIVWTDMRPLSLRKQMDAAVKGSVTQSESGLNQHCASARTV